MDDNQEIKIRSELMDICIHIDRIVEKIKTINPEPNNPSETEIDKKSSD